MKPDIPTPSIASAPAPTQGPQASGPLAPVLVTKARHGRDVAISRERLIMAMMVVVTVAFAAGLYIQFELPALTAALSGTGLWALLAALHSVSSKGEQVDHLKGEIQRLESEIVQIKGYLGPQRAPLQAAHVANPATPVPEAAQAPVPAADRAGHAMSHKLEPDPRWETPKAPPKSKLAKPKAESPVAAAPAEAALPPDVRKPDVSIATYHEPAPTTPPVANAPKPADPLRDAWSFRPNARAPHDPATTSAASVPAAIAPPPVTAIDRELEIVQQKIKALAAEVNAAEVSRPPVVAEPAPMIPAAWPAALDHSVGALNKAAQTMRERIDSQPQPIPQPQQARAPEARTTEVRTPESRSFLPADFFIPATAQRIAVSTLAPEPNTREREVMQPPLSVLPVPRDVPVVPQAHVYPAPISVPAAAAPAPPVAPAMAPAPDTRVAAIAHAIENGNMDVYFSPIVGLQDQAVRHFEISVRLKAPAGSYIDYAEDVIELAGADLAGLFDSARLTRSASFASRLDSLRKPGAVLSRASGAAMTDGRFLETFARLYEERQTIAAQLVLTFSQSDVTRLTPSAWQALGDMHAFGFRFAIDKVDHLDMDFETLVRRGFVFAKLPALAFSGGLPLANSIVPPGDICRHLASSGLTLIAEAIDDEALRARIFGFGILFGQGQLFGGPRPIALDAVARTAAA